MRLAALAVAGAFLAGTARAELIQIDATTEVQSARFTDPVINVGDRFRIRLVYDDSAVDVNAVTPIVPLADFPGAVVEFELFADPGNTGTLDPSSAVLTPAQARAIEDDFLAFRADATGVPAFPILGETLDGFELVFEQAGLLNPAAATLASGADPHYSLLKLPAGCNAGNANCQESPGNQFGPNAYVVQTSSGPFNTGPVGTTWANNAAGSKWIGPRADQSDANAFVGGNFSHVRLCSVSSAADPTCAATAIIAGSNSGGAAGSGTNVVINSGFTGGLMALDFAVYNANWTSPGFNNPSGLQVLVTPATAEMAATSGKVP